MAEPGFDNRNVFPLVDFCGWVLRLAFFALDLRGAISLYVVSGCRAGAADQLITQHGGAHFLNSGFIEIIQVERAIGYPDQAADPITDMFDDAADFPVFTFFQHHGQPGITGALPIECGLDALIAHAFDGDAIGQSGQFVRVNPAMNTDTVFAAPAL